MAEDGTPMHKSKGNMVVFDQAAERVGADTMRWLYANHVPEQISTSHVSPQKRIWRSCSDEHACTFEREMDADTQDLDKIWNIYWFFVTMPT